MKYLVALVVITSVLAETLCENKGNKVKKRWVYGEGLLDAASIGSTSFDSALGNTAIISGLSSGLQGASLPGLSVTGGGSLISKQVTVQNDFAVPIPQPYAVPITRTVAVPIPQPVRVPVDRPYPVRVPHPVPYPVDRPYPVTVEKPYPVPVPHPVPVKVFRAVPYPVPRPVPVPIVNTVPVPVSQHVVPSLAGSSLNGLTLGAGLSGASLGLSSIPSVGYGGLYGGKVIGLGSTGW